MGFIADLLFGDPRRGHPVAVFGRGASALEQLTYSDTRRAGVLHTGALLGALGVLGAAIERAARSGGPASTVAATAAATFIALGRRRWTRRALPALRWSRSPRIRPTRRWRR